MSTSTVSTSEHSTASSTDVEANVFAFYRIVNIIEDQYEDSRGNPFKWDLSVKWWNAPDYYYSDEDYGVVRSLAGLNTLLSSQHAKSESTKLDIADHIEDLEFCSGEQDLPVRAELPFSLPPPRPPRNPYPTPETRAVDDGATTDESEEELSVDNEEIPDEVRQEAIQEGLKEEFRVEALLSLQHEHGLDLAIMRLLEPSDAL